MCVNFPCVHGNECIVYKGMCVLVYVHVYNYVCLIKCSVVCVRECMCVIFMCNLNLCLVFYECVLGYVYIICMYMYIIYMVIHVCVCMCVRVYI